MQLLELSMKNFASFVDTKVFKFPRKHGLHFITGENKSEPRLEGNGVGKTTIWNAITWAFYDKDLKGRRASDICNWSVKGGVVVSVKYMIDDEVYTVTRTWNPNSFKITMPNGDEVDLSKDEANLLMHHLKLTYDMFTKAIIFGQKEPMFLDMKPPEKSELFSNVMNLNKWIDLSNKASIKASSIKETIAVKENEISEVVGKISSLQAINYDEEIKAWDEKHQEKISKTRQEIANTRALLRGAVQHSSGLVREAESKLYAMTKLKEEVKVAESKSRDIHDVINTLSNQISRKEGEVMSVSKRLKFLASTGDLCPSCGQDIKESHKKAIKEQTDAEILAINNRTDSLNVKYAEAIEQGSQIDSILNDLTEKLHQASNATNEANQLSNQERRRVTDLKQQLESLDIELHNTEQESNTFVTIQSNRDHSIALAEKELKELTSEIEYLQADHMSTSYWIKGFKEIRLYLISETLQQLEIETNSSLTQLGLVDWRIRFDVDKESKGGKIQKGFNVMILSPNNKEAVAWDSWSGGESQRLRLAASMGLANLIKSHTGCTLNFEVWDEPTTSMSSNGVVSFLDKLKDRSNTENLQIWIIDHTTLGYNDFDSIVKVVKTSEGSRIL